MADLRGQELRDSYQNVVTRGTGNKLDDGNGVEFADLDDKASLSGGADADFTAMPQVGGSPIIERDSNDDGEFIRFADGTQIISMSPPTPSTDGGNDTVQGLTIYYSSLYTINFPNSFINEFYRISNSIFDASGSRRSSNADVRVFSKSLSSMDVQNINGLNTSARSTEFNWIIKGDWK